MAKNKDTNPVDFLSGFFLLPIKTWRRIALFDFAANISMIGVALSALSILMFIGFASVIQYYGGLETFFRAAHWLDLVALRKVDDFVRGTPGNIVGTLAIAGFIIGGFIVLRLIESVFNQEWGKIYKHTFMQRIPTYWMTMTLVPSFFAASVAWSLYYTHELAASQNIFGMGGFAHLGQYLFSVMAFTFLYKILNDPAVNYRSGFLGALWAALFFEVIKTSLVAATNLDLELASPIGTFLIYTTLLCIGFVFISGALVFGNHITYEDQNRLVLEELTIPHQRAELRPLREIALAALLEMTRRFYLHGKGEEIILGMDPLDLAKIARTTPQRGKHVIRLLEKVDLVKIIQDGYRETAILKVHPDHLSLDEFLNRLEQRVEAKALNIPSPLQDPSNTWFWQEYERALKDRFGSLSLKDLAELNMIMKKKDAA